jgi:hypothetical protein
MSADGTKPRNILTRTGRSRRAFLEGAALAAAGASAGVGRAAATVPEANPPNCGKTVYASEGDRRRCQKARVRRT